jgi:retinol dehydrogenase-12
MYSNWQALLDRNAKVYIAGRDETKGSEALLWLKTQTGKDAHFLQLDLANLKTVKASAEQYIGCVFGKKSHEVPAG